MKSARRIPILCSSEETFRRAQTIKPLVRATTSDILWYIEEPEHLWTTNILDDPRFIGNTDNLEQVAKIVTYHLRRGVGISAASVGEVLSQIPEKELAGVVAFECQPIKSIGGTFQLSTTILYGKKAA